VRRDEGKTHLDRQCAPTAGIPGRGATGVAKVTLPGRKAMSRLPMTPARTSPEKEKQSGVSSRRRNLENCIVQPWTTRRLHHNGEHVSPGPHPVLPHRRTLSTRMSLA